VVLLRTGLALIEARERGSFDVQTNDQNNADSGTDHAQYRQCCNGRSDWMSPRRYAGSYDLSNPHPMNRSAMADSLLVYTEAGAPYAAFRLRKATFLGRGWGIAIVNPL